MWKFNTLLLLVEQTNLYVWPEHAPSHKWEDITVIELKAFFGVLIHMGIFKKPVLDIARYSGL